MNQRERILDEALRLINAALLREPAVALFHFNLGNVLLDRALVVDPAFGYLAPALTALQSELLLEGPDA